MEFHLLGEIQNTIFFCAALLHASVVVMRLVVGDGDDGSDGGVTLLAILLCGVMLALIIFS